MDWKIFLTAFVTVFIAEIGDKTQMASFSLAAEQRSSFSVWLGAVLALATATTVSVLIGRALSEFVNPRVLRVIAGSIFIVLGVWILARR